MRMAGIPLSLITNWGRWVSNSTAVHRYLLEIPIETNKTAISESLAVMRAAINKTSEKFGRIEDENCEVTIKNSPSKLKFL